MASDGFRWLPMASDGFRWLAAPTLAQARQNSAGRPAMREPTTWALHAPGSYGRPFHEAESPAASLSDLRDYLHETLPALQYCRHLDAPDDAMM